MQEHKILKRYNNAWVWSEFQGGQSENGDDHMTMEAEKPRDLRSVVLQAERITVKFDSEP